MVRILCLLAATLLLSSCGELIACKHRTGQFVESVLSGARGQITRGLSHVREGYQCQYEVRFPVNQEFTDARILEADGPITAQPFGLVWMWEFELRNAKQ